MPELPEVETIRLGLQKYLVGKTIEDVEVRLRKGYLEINEIPIKIFYLSLLTYCLSLAGVLLLTIRK